MDWEASSRCRRNYEPRSFGSVPTPLDFSNTVLYDLCFVLFFFSPNGFSYRGSYFKSRGGRLQNLQVCCGGDVAQGVAGGA